MKRYLVKSEHYVYKKDGKPINFYNMSAEVRGKDVKEAIKNYIEKVLFFTYDEKCIEIIQDKVYFSNMVDEDNCEDDENGKYISDNYICIYELKKINLRSVKWKE